MLDFSKLHAYQKNAVKFIKSRKRCALWLGLGLGKTVITLTAINDLLKDLEIKRVLIIAPLRVAKSVWSQEIKQWKHLNDLTINVAVGNAIQRKKAITTDSNIVVINRDNINWFIDNYYDEFKLFKFDMIVIDESSSFKNPKTKRFKALKKITHFINYSILLTGTPASNSMLDVWSQFYYVDHGKRLGRTFYNFTTRFFDRDGYGGYNLILKQDADVEIYNKLNDVTLSMRSENYINLPKIQHINEHIEFDDKIKSIYKKFENQFYLEFTNNDEVTAVNSAVLINKLIQLANGAMYVNDSKKYKTIHNLKLDRLSEIIDDNSNENIMIAYNYKSDLERLAQRFPDAIVLTKDEKIITKWNNGEIRLLLVHPASCGHGLNLQHGGSILIYFSLIWSLELYLQLNGRLHRQGQKNMVRIYHLLIKDTVDDIVLAALNKKELTQNSLIDAIKTKIV